MILSVAFITNTLLISIIFTFSFCLLRAYTGGYHSKSYAGCYAVTMINYILLLIINSSLGAYKAYVSLVIMIASVFIIWKFAPIKHVNNPFDENERDKYKNISRILISVLSVFFVLSIAYLSDDIVFVLAWAVFTTALLMLLEIILQKRKNHEQS